MQETLYNPFINFEFRVNTCFLTGEKLDESSAPLYIFPEWIMDAFELKEQPFKLLDETNTTYGKLSLPCSQKAKEKIELLQNQVAAAFENPDWVDVTLHSYRHRWGHAQGDPSYAAQIAALKPLPVIVDPMLVIHGGADAVNPPQTSAGKEQWFSGPYRRIVLEDVGHFPQRERPTQVAEALIDFFKTRS